MYTVCACIHALPVCQTPENPKGSVSFQLGGVPAPSLADQAVDFSERTCQNRAPQIPISAQSDPSLEVLQSLPQRDDRRCVWDRPCHPVTSHLLARRSVCLFFGVFLRTKVNPFIP